MYQEFYMGNQLLHLPVLAMVLFMVTFTAVVVRTWRRAPGSNRMDAMAQLPLDDDGAEAPVEGLRR